eukprot:1155933-Pelagomonas_calceolata.AAC.1
MHHMRHARQAQPRLCTPSQPTKDSVVWCLYGPSHNKLGCTPAAASQHPKRCARALPYHALAARRIQALQHRQLRAQPAHQAHGLLRPPLHPHPCLPLLLRLRRLRCPSQRERRLSLRRAGSGVADTTAPAVAVRMVGGARARWGWGVRTRSAGARGTRRRAACVPLMVSSSWERGRRRWVKGWGRRVERDGGRVARRGAAEHGGDGRQVVLGVLCGCGMGLESCRSCAGVL